eukprot:415376-Hanusia_phi.AAC.2
MFQHFGRNDTMVSERDVLVWTREHVIANLHKPLRDIAPRAAQRRPQAAETEIAEGRREGKGGRRKLGSSLPASAAATGRVEGWVQRMLEWGRRDWIRTISLLLVAGLSPKLIVAMYSGFLNVSEIIERTYRYTA